MQNKNVVDAKNKLYIFFMKYNKWYQKYLPRHVGNSNVIF